MTAGVDLRVARADWRLETGYRLYLQSGADFFQDKYTMDPANYTYYTSDKELGQQVGHLVHVEISTWRSRRRQASERHAPDAEPPARRGPLRIRLPSCCRRC